jgi:hypothetical protein
MTQGDGSDGSPLAMLLTATTRKRYLEPGDSSRTMLRTVNELPEL